MGDAGRITLYIPKIADKCTAEEVRDYVEGNKKYRIEYGEPWALGLARRCYDMASGNLLHLPFSGGVWDQDDTLMYLIGIARQAWYVFKYMPANKMKWDEDDSAFMVWVDGKESDGQD
jgi:hypothetical protein